MCKYVFRDHSLSREDYMITNPVAVLITLMKLSTQFINSLSYPTL